jgi:hypothetical protein
MSCGQQRAPFAGKLWASAAQLHRRHSLPCWPPMTSTVGLLFATTSAPLPAAGRARSERDRAILDRMAGDDDACPP